MCFKFFCHHFHIFYLLYVLHQWLCCENTQHLSISHAVKLNNNFSSLTHTRTSEKNYPRDAIECGFFVFVLFYEKCWKKLHCSWGEKTLSWFLIYEHHKQKRRKMYNNRDLVSSSELKIFFRIFFVNFWLTALAFFTWTFSLFVWCMRYTHGWS